MFCIWVCIHSVKTIPSACVCRTQVGIGYLSKLLLLSKVYRNSQNEHYIRINSMSLRLTGGRVDADSHLTECSSRTQQLAIMSMCFSPCCVIVVCTNCTLESWREVSALIFVCTLFFPHKCWKQLDLVRWIWSPVCATESTERKACSYYRTSYWYVIKYICYSNRIYTDLDQVSNTKSNHLWCPTLLE